MDDSGSAKKRKPLTITERQFLANLFAGDNETDAFLNIPGKADTDRQRAGEAGCRMLKRIRERIDFLDLLDENHLGDVDIAIEARRLLHVKKPFFGPNGDMVESDDGPTQAKALDLVVEMRGRKKNDINLNVKDISIGEPPKPLDPKEGAGA